MDLSTYRYFKQLHIQQVLALTYYLRQLSRKFAENSSNQGENSSPWSKTASSQWLMMINQDKLFSGSHSHNALDALLPQLKPFLIDQPKNQLMMINRSSVDFDWAPYGFSLYRVYTKKGFNWSRYMCCKCSFFHTASGDLPGSYAQFRDLSAVSIDNGSLFEAWSVKRLKSLKRGSNCTLSRTMSYSYRPNNTRLILLGISLLIR